MSTPFTKSNEGFTPSPKSLRASRLVEPEASPPQRGRGKGEWGSSPKESIRSLIGFKSLVEREIVRFTSVFMQTLFPPLVSSFLYISIFGFTIGRHMKYVHGMPYLNFLIPGLIMMYLIESSYSNTSSSLFIARWSGHIQEILVSPLS